MAEHAAVTDTHPLLYFAAGDRRLGPRAAAMFSAASHGRALIYVPVAVMMEVVFLARVGRGGLRVPPADFFSRLFLNTAFQPIDLTIEQVLLADELRPNRDPYDALIVAAARVSQLPLITRDVEITESGLVKVVW